jgi:hypothetical protein
MEPSIFDYDPAAKKGILNLRMVHGRGRPERGTVGLRKPALWLSEREFECILADPDLRPETTLCFWLDVEKWSFPWGDPVPSSPSLGKAVAAELRRRIGVTEYLVRGKSDDR